MVHDNNRSVSCEIGWKFLNALVIALITFVSSLSIQFPPSAQNLWASTIAFALVLLTQLRAIIATMNGRKLRRKPELLMIL